MAATYDNSVAVIPRSQKLALILISRPHNSNIFALVVRLY